jgi:hypothetical protein
MEDFVKDKVRKNKTVPIEIYRELGFSPEMSLEDAKRRAREINKKTTLEREKVAAANRAKTNLLYDQLYFPEDYVKEFEEYLRLTSFGTPKHIEKLLSHFKYIQVMLLELLLEPNEYFKKNALIYKYFRDNAVSLDYANKLLRVLNMWGSFLAEKRGQFFKPLEPPRGPAREQIREAYLNSEEYRGPSDILTPWELEEKIDLLPRGWYEWLFVSIWFGLRPNEISKDIEYKDGVIYVYQPKLTGIPIEDRYKAIPILFTEQETALEYLINNRCIRPRNIVLREIFPGRITLYAGRKGFVDLMQDRDCRLEDISSWLGHQNIQTTWAKYRNRKRIGG